MSDVMNGNGGGAMYTFTIATRLRAPFWLGVGAGFSAVPCHGLSSGRFWGH
jgi:hypothetical protein